MKTTPLKSSTREFKAEGGKAQGGQLSSLTVSWLSETSWTTYDRFRRKDLIVKDSWTLFGAENAFH
jgi:hypothetical protein